MTDAKKEITRDCVLLGSLKVEGMDKMLQEFLKEIKVDEELMVVMPDASIVPENMTYLYFIEKEVKHKVVYNELHQKEIHKCENLTHLVLLDTTKLLEYSYHRDRLYDIFQQGVNKDVRIMCIFPDSTFVPAHVQSVLERFTSPPADLVYQFITQAMTLAPLAAQATLKAELKRIYIEESVSELVAHTCSICDTTWPHLKLEYQ